MKKKKKKLRLTDEALCDAIHQAIGLAGWTMPTDEASVADAEARMAIDGIELPPPLGDLEFPSAADNPKAGKVMPLWDPQVLFSPMARAAREGGTIAPEVEAIMKRDREIAEQELRERQRKNRDTGENEDG